MKSFWLHTKNKQNPKISFKALCDYWNKMCICKIPNFLPALQAASTGQGTIWLCPSVSTAQMQGQIILQASIGCSLEPLKPVLF